MAKTKFTDEHGRVRPAPSRSKGGVSKAAATKAASSKGVTKRGEARAKANDAAERATSSQAGEEKDHDGDGSDFDEDDEDLDLEMVDVESELKKCRPPPSKLLVADWVKEYGLVGTGKNPKSWYKGYKKDEEMIPIFGKRYGDRGRAGYKWQDCPHKEMLARALELHPIIYMHDKDHMPPYLKVRFAEGIVHEHQNGVGSVNWAAYAQQVNKTQRTRRTDKRKRLEICKERGVEKIAAADMAQIEIDVEPSCVEPASTSKKVCTVLDVCRFS